MGRGLITSGAALLAATVAFWVSDALGWIASSIDDQISPLTLKAGLAFLAAGVILRLLSPVRTQLGRTRCATCGRPTARGHVYCLDHLQASVNAWRDQTRDGLLRRRKT